MEVTMRKWMLCLVALAAVTVSAKAQSPQNGLKTGYIALQYTGEVLPGQMNNFKQVVAKVIAAVAQEPGTLMYEWTLRPDQKTFDVVELYKNSDAVVAHIKHVLGDFGKELGEVQKGTSLVVHGSPNEEVRQAAAGLNPVYQTPIDGFVK
jgi:quinol monooxygenase YgiN